MIFTFFTITLIVVSILFGIIFLISLYHFFIKDMDGIGVAIFFLLLFTGLTWGVKMNSSYKEWVEEVPRDNFSITFTKSYCLIETPNGDITKISSYEEVFYWKDSTNLANAVFYKKLYMNYYNEIKFDGYKMCNDKKWKTLPKGEIILN